MKTFKSFIKESVRVGLPHIHSTTTPAGNQTPSLSTDQFEKSTTGGKLHVHDVTEKTDGQTLVMGHDKHGFFTQHSGSGDERIRTGQGHIDRAKKRAKETGKEYRPEAPEAFAKFHDALHKNKALQDHLAAVHKKTGKDVIVRGEAFNRHLASPGAKKGEAKFVHTSYSTKNMGKHGSFIIHSKLPDNQQHDTEHFKKLSDSNVTIDDDKIAHKPAHIDVKDEVNDYHKLDHGLINSRTTPKTKAAKLAEVEKFNNIKKRVYNKVRAHVQSQGVKPKWGSGTEGLIVHPSEHNPEAARFKITSDAFKKSKTEASRFGDKK